MQITTAPSPYGTGYQTNISVVAGETVALPLTLSSGGAPLNLTGYSLKATIGLPTPLLLNTGNGGITVTGAAGGVAQVNIPSATTAAFPPGGYPYDLWMVSGGGAETPLLSGTFAVSQNVTAVP